VEIPLVSNETYDRRLAGDGLPDIDLSKVLNDQTLEFVRDVTIGQVAILLTLVSAEIVLDQLFIPELPSKFGC
jgi:hypothetical protein